MMTQYASSVIRHSRSLLGSAFDAEDAAQEVFVKAFRFRHSLRGENLRGWLGTITHRECLDRLRGKKRDPLLPGETFNPPDPGKPDETDPDLELLTVLTPIEREVLLLRVIEELPFKEVAQMLEMNEGSVRNVYVRATKRLREEHRQ